MNLLMQMMIKKAYNLWLNALLILGLIACLSSCGEYKYSNCLLITSKGEIKYKKNVLKIDGFDCNNGIGFISKTKDFVIISQNRIPLDWSFHLARKSYFLNIHNNSISERNDEFWFDENDWSLRIYNGDTLTSDEIKKIPKSEFPIIYQYDDKGFGTDYYWEKHCCERLDIWEYSGNIIYTYQAPDSIISPIFPSNNEELISFSVSKSLSKEDALHDKVDNSAKVIVYSLKEKKVIFSQKFENTNYAKVSDDGKKIMLFTSNKDNSTCSDYLIRIYDIKSQEYHSLGHGIDAIFL